MRAQNLVFRGDQDRQFGINISTFLSEKREIESGKTTVQRYLKYCLCVNHLNPAIFAI